MRSPLPLLVFIGCVNFPKATQGRPLPFSISSAPPTSSQTSSPSYQSPLRPSSSYKNNGDGRSVSNPHGNRYLNKQWKKWQKWKNRQQTRRPSPRPTPRPSPEPSSQPTSNPSNQPSSLPSSKPTSSPSSLPSTSPSYHPTSRPSSQPTTYPSSSPSYQPTSRPSSHVTGCCSHEFITLAYYLACIRHLRRRHVGCILG
jgi:hypothetical protein